MCQLNNQPISKKSITGYRVYEIFHTSPQKEGSYYNQNERTPLGQQVAAYTQNDPFHAFKTLQDVEKFMNTFAAGVDYLYEGISFVVFEVTFSGIIKEGWWDDKHRGMKSITATVCCLNKIVKTYVGNQNPEKLARFYFSEVEEWEEQPNEQS
ncbi:MAG: hypothetical protein NTZ48_05655 [Candidatus Omnitrophica bacterium]|nr:hypothetical protein [Candidatus Omnitrophota bacterium]